jgi:outer membrane receptor protein involved in Fe transport
MIHPLRIPFAAAACFAAAITALDAQPVVTAAPDELSPMISTGRGRSLLGTASSANEGLVGSEELARRPLLRPGEIVEAVPGVVVTQHSGAGKSNQFFLRGFNLDHGTDLATSLEGVPVNMRSHGHGQGYTDLNFLIPEFVREVGFKKGPYFAEEGDFSSAGAFDIRYFTRLPRNFLSLEGGSFGYARLVYGQSVDLARGTLTFGTELFHHDGPWDNPDDFQKFNAIVRYGEGTQEEGWSIMAMAYHGDWTATDQIPRRAVNRGFPRFGSLDESTGGDSSRYSLQMEWHREDDRSATKALLYGMYYDLDLFSNFTYFLSDPDNGDQFEQKDRRIHWGAKLAHTIFSELGKAPAEHTFGLDFRQDNIRNGLYLTKLRNRFETTRSDHIIETSAGVYYRQKIRWTDWFRTEAGVRGDFFHFDVDSSMPVNSGSETDAIVSPKLSLVFGPWADTEFYINGGFGYHSNDARGVVTRFDPVERTQVDPADPLVRTKGAEFGIRTTILPNLQSTVALWVLDIDSELLFVGDAGTTEASRPSRRWGVEWSNFWKPTDWLTLDADLAWSEARFRDAAIEGRRIPGSIETVASVGASVHDLLGGFYASVRWRYFGPRDLTEDGNFRSASTSLVNAEAGYRFNDTWSAAVEVFNVFDEKASDIDYYYASRLRKEASGPDEGGYNDFHFHPVESRQIRFKISATF